MELKIDLIRDVLLYAESLPLGKTSLDVPVSESPFLKKYTEDEIVYALSKMGNDDAHLVNGSINWINAKPYFWSIGTPTYLGHQYLDNIREQKVWDHVKKKAKTVGSVSLPILNQIAASYIKQLLGLQ
ncbi:DUF2513 domain-containing protein [Enterococcus asini]|uniref:DUF2513 domain-containing protein n=1 Tax=Enterococcus asini TaxID=57732 RepID=UPI00288E7715|nr:DUF2513 domain-containing protein [Enterococcus asini]MDT2756967.1 DUF2513 domain-containing protein [Enterococcus asini]